MNKKFLILPIVSALLLAGCTLGGKKSKKKKKSSSGEVTSVQPGTSEQGSSSQQGGSSSQPGGSSTTPTQSWTAQELSVIAENLNGMTLPYIGGLDLEYCGDGYLFGVDHTKAECDAYAQVLLNNGFTLEADSQGDYYWKADDAQTGEAQVWFTTEDNTNWYFGAIFAEYQTAELESIALSGTYPTTFEQGDPFSHAGLVVTATYSDGSTEDVSSSATFSGYDMSSATTQTVTVTYEEGGVTETATYSITVNPVVQKVVTYDANGGSGTMAQDSASQGKEYTLKPCTFTAPEGKAFKEWNTTADGSGTKVAAEGKYTVNDDVTFYAQWANEFTVSFAAGEGSGTMAPVKVGEGGSIATAPACTFTAPEGKEFDKWVIGTEAVTFPYTVTDNVTLTATWKDKPVPVEDRTVTKTVEQLATAYSWVTGTVYSNFNLDDVVSVSASEGQNNGKYWEHSSGKQYRLFQSENGTMTISAATGYTIKSITLTFSYQETGILKLGETQISTDTAVEINSSSATFTVSQTDSSKHGKIFITQFSVTYGAA